MRRRVTAYVGAAKRSEGQPAHLLKHLGQVAALLRCRLKAATSGRGDPTRRMCMPPLTLVRLLSKLLRQRVGLVLVAPGFFPCP